MAIIETEIWKISPDNPRALIFDSQRAAQDIFNELEAHLKADGRLPDEYFLYDNRNWTNGALFPKDAEILCNVNYGGSEGVYLDIAVKYEKDVYERSQKTGELGWVNRPVIEHFATGKTLGETIDDLDKMNLAAASVMAAFYGSKREIEERYAKIESGEIAPVYLSAEQRKAEALNALEQESAVTSKTIYGEVQRGDWVISIPSDEYGCLIGTVTAIDKLGTPEHGTENTTDDIHVDFTAFDYPPERIAEIEEIFSDLYGEPKAFDELPLDDVIMAPDTLIRITHLGHDEIAFMGNLRVNCESFCNSFAGPVPQNEKHAELLARLEQNHEGYFNSLLSFGTRELVEMSEKISAMSGAFSYLNYRGFESDELEFLLSFKNPLEIVAEGWLDYSQDVHDEMGYAFDAVMRDKQDWLDSYPLMSDTGAPERAKAVSPPEKAEQTAEKPKPKTLAEKMQAATEKVKAQEAQGSNSKSHKREERE